MATVYLADDLKHERKVALKVLKPELAAVVGAERFLTEIKTTANLQHPHILPLHDSGEADGFLYYVMPYIEGESLRDRLEREKQLPVDEAVRIATDIAEALHAAHEQGVIHRDVKPANILLSKGRPLVADFGIALAVSAAGAGRLTETGLSMGTPYYMSPEQASADREPTPASDVYSLACVLYEMLVGEPPYTASSAQAVLAKILTEEARAPGTTRASIPNNVDAAIRKALDKVPADRFSSTAAFAEALANRGFELPRATKAVEVPAAPTRTGWPVPAVLAGAAAVASVSFIGGRSMAPATSLPLARFEVPAAEGLTALTVCCGPSQTMSPDGEWLVYVGVPADGGSRMLYRRRLDQLDAEVISGTEGASSPFFSPNGLFIGFHSDGRIRKVAMAGGSPVPIAEIDRIDGGSWGDNDMIVFTTVGQEGTDLMTVPAAGGEPSLVPGEPAERRMYPWMLPGGDAALTRAGTGAESRIVAIDLSTGQEDTLGFGTRAAFASGYLVTSSADGTLLAQPFDPGSRTTTGAAIALLDGVSLSGPGVGEFTLSAEGTLAYVLGGQGGSTNTLVIHGPEGPEVVPLTTTGNLGAPTFSPDGRQIAFQIRGDAGALWIWDRDQLTQRHLVDDAFVPVWSPDGAWIAFQAATGDGPEIHRIASDGSGEAELLLAEEFFVGPGSWTPDGRYFAVTGRSPPDIGFLDIESGEVRWVMEDDVGDVAPQVSPDGQWLLYSSSRSGDLEVYIRALDGTGGLTQVSAGGGHSPRWAPSGGAVYYAADRGGNVIEATVSFDGAPRVVDRAPRGAYIADFASMTFPWWDVGPNDDELVYIGSGNVVEGLIVEDPTFVWILNWTEIVSGLAGGR